MTREEAIRRLKETRFTIQPYQYTNEALDMAIEVLEQEPRTDYKSFCEFVAEVVMEEDFELNAGAIAEIFCRKLANLGIVKADGDKWILESEE